MVTEDIADIVKVGAAFAPASASFMGIPLQDWMYYVSIFAALLLIFERLPGAWNTALRVKEKVYGWFKK